MKMKTMIAIMLVLALAAALAIDSARLHASGFYRIVIFLPYAVPAVVAVLMWGYIYGDQFGLAGNINDLCALYTAADVYVSASCEETFGMTLIEAMACGTQVVCYDATAMPELVTEDVGEAVPVHDVDALADAVRRLCAEPKDSKACIEHAKDYDLNERFNAYLRLYEKMYRFSPACQAALKSKS